MAFDVVSYMKAKQLEAQLNQAIAAGDNMSGWAAERDAIRAEVAAKFSDQNKQSQVIKHGVQVINSSLDSPVDVEIQGRTLVSLGQSNLENGKSYLLADKKTKIRVDGSKGALVSGVSKFAKTVLTTVKADFSGKVAGSLVENPNITKERNQIGLITPTGGYEYTPTNIFTLNTVCRTTTTSVLNEQSQQLFSFNIIEEVERKIGRIPASTVAGKVQWLRDNVNIIRFNWHGFASSVGGNKATIAVWNGSAWITAPWTHTNSSVSKLTVQAIPATGWFAMAFQNDGFAHYLAYAEPSDGVTPSTISTDYVELEIELKSTAVLDTRPILTRVANFEGKVSGSTVEVPHVSRYNRMSTLVVPTNGAEQSQANYNNVSRLDGAPLMMYSSSVNGEMAQQLFSFDIIAEIERNLGRIPKATLADKVQWCKDNVARLSCNWYGYGAGPAGNKASLCAMNGGGATWSVMTNHVQGTVTKITGTFPSSWITSNSIDPNGFTHFLAYAEPSDGSTPSTINTDYVELEIELKQGVTLHDPIVPLYEVDSAEYTNILVAWNEAEVLNRYPRVQGVQHLQNPYIMAEGENLLPPITDGILYADTVVKSPYDIEKTTTTVNSYAWEIKREVVPNQNVVFMFEGNGYVYCEAFDSKDQRITILIDDNKNSYQILTPANTKYLKFIFYNKNKAGLFTWKNWSLTLGSTAKPFTPRNPSYLFAQTKLGQIGSVKDSLFKQEGGWFVRKNVEKDVALDGTIPWVPNVDYTGYKRVYYIPSLPPISVKDSTVMTFSGKFIKDWTTWSNGDQMNIADGRIYLSVSDVDSGFGETYTPDSSEWKAYFNGWQAKTVDANGKPTAWRSLGDGTDAPTQTLAYVSANKAPNYTPYKLSYVLATPKLEPVNVEGDIAVNGLTQVEVGSGVVVREKVTPFLSGNYYIINRNGAISSKLKNKLGKFVSIYKNQIVDTGNWLINTYDANGNNGAEILKEKFDTTAEYTVTYLVLDRHQFTNNGLEIKATYDTSLKSVIDTLVEKQADLFTQTGLTVQGLAEVYKRLKALGG